ncbi:MAG: hypothetical protein ABFD91_08075 [Anaerohalosphaeraceae bacterium]
MPQLSLTKIFAAILGIIILINLREALGVFGPVYDWFCESLDGIRNFPEGAQTAIAFLSIALACVIVSKHIKK